MVTFNRYTIVKESLEKQVHANRYHPAQELHVTDHGVSYVYTLGAGSGDDIHVFAEHMGQTDDNALRLYVLTINTRMGYAGVEVFQSGEAIGDVFFQSEDELKDTIGRKGLDYAPRTIVNRLAEYCL